MSVPDDERERDRRHEANERALDRGHEANERQIDRRTEMQNLSARGLFLLNGGGALALLAFLQQVWTKPEMATFVPWIVWALVSLLFGLLLAGTYGEVRAASSRAHSALWNNRDATEQQTLQQAANRWFIRNRWWPIVSVGMFVISIVIVIAGALSNLPATPAAAQATPTGNVTQVRDGDTIEVGGVAVRLNGVAAPELNEPAGQEAKQFMISLVAGKAVRCELNGERTYDRMVGVCFLDGRDIGASVISAGLARDCARFSGGRYDAFNTAASEWLPVPGYRLRR